jgi:hypothetical protein
MGKSWRSRSRSATGQSVVEFALILPIVVFLMIGIVDLGRIYTTMLSIESAAREGADYGAFGSYKWDAGTFSVAPDGVLAKMELRGCTAASDLPDYVGPNDNCANPTFSYEISGNNGGSWSAYDPTVPPWSVKPCDDDTRDPPCWVKVTMHYDFQLLVPFHLDVFGMQLGIPDVLTFERTSVFAMTDIEP